MSTEEIVAAFLTSGYDSGRYRNWSLDRQLVAFLSNNAAMARVLDNDAAYNAVYTEILARRRISGLQRSGRDRHDVF